jgi:hypothetical protein
LSFFSLPLIVHFVCDLNLFSLFPDPGSEKAAATDQRSSYSGENHYY